jgi:hypothetical protein
MKPVRVFVIQKKSSMKTYIYLSCLACLLCVACKDESLREDLEQQEKKAAEESGEYIDDGSIRVVTDTAAALAAPNCVMVRPGETIEIPVAKAFAVWEKYQDLFGKKFSPRGDLSAALMWAYPNGLLNFDEIEIVNYEDVNKAAIRLTPKAGMTGNAQVAVAIAGEIRWSWHVWVTDYNPGPDLTLEQLSPGPNDVPGGKVYRYKNNAGDNIFMDRNLGANSADRDNYKETIGMYYQWGKKDPMPGFAAPNSLFQYGPPAEYRMNNLAYSIEFPDEWILGGEYGDWYSYNNKYDHDLWGWVSGKKAIYDPCPEGWKVPLYAREQHDMEVTWHTVYDVFEYSPFYVAEPENGFVNVESGIYSPAFGFFPRSGYIMDGEVERFQSRFANGLVLWTASAHDPANGPLEAGYVVWLDGYGAAHTIKEWGMNIRCIRSTE